MGADRVAHGEFRCSHGCQFGGECPGHAFEVWYREGRYYIPQDGVEYRQGVVLDAAFLDAIVEAMAEKD